MRRVLQRLILVFAAVIPVAAIAHGTAFLEFAPASADFAYLSAIASPVQVITPQNDFLSGVDLWVDNEGDPGVLTVALRDPQGGERVRRTVTVPTIPVHRLGERFHIDFGQMIPVEAGGKYRLAFETSMPSLRIFYGQRLRLLLHNDEYVPEHAHDFAEFGGAREDFSFKFSLYELAETASPVVGRLLAIPRSSSELRLSFNVNEPADYEVRYGPEGQGLEGVVAYRGFFSFCAEGVAECEAVLPVVPRTAYSFRLTAKDAWGNSVSVDGSFVPESGAPGEESPPPEAPPPADTTPPQIFGARVVTQRSRSLSVVWGTDEAADSRMIVSPDAAFGRELTSVSDHTYELPHTLDTREVLRPSTQYSIRIFSSDPAGNERSVSLAARTAGEEGPPPPPESDEGNVPPPPPPSTASSSPSGDEGVSGGDAEAAPYAGEIGGGDERSGGVAIRWVDPDSSEGYRIDIFTSDHVLKEQVYVSASVREVYVRHLTPGEYYAIVYAIKSGAFRKLAKPVGFTVPSPIERILGTGRSSLEESRAMRFRALFLIVPVIAVLGLGSLVAVRHLPRRARRP